MKDVYIKRKDILDFDALNKKDLQKIGIEKDIISIWELLGYMQDLLYEVERLEEEYEDFKKDVEDNYKPVSVEEQIGWNHNW